MRDSQQSREPTETFVEHLRAQIGHEVRRRNRETSAHRWSAWSAPKVALAATVLILVSMGIGGAVVAAAYEAQISDQRDKVLATWEQHAALARQRLELAARDQQAAQRRFDVGLATPTDVMEKGAVLAQAESQVAVMNLHLEEIRLTGREPRTELSAPRVSGRDFVGERLRIELAVPEMVLAIERKLAQDNQDRVKMGTTSPVELEVSRSRVRDAEVALDTVRRKLAIRQQFLSGKVDAVETELRVLEADAEQLTRALKPQIALAEQEVARLTGRSKVGLAQAVDVAEATVRRLELEMALSKAELDLALIRRRIDQHRSGRS